MTDSAVSGWISECTQHKHLTELRYQLITRYKSVSTDAQQLHTDLMARFNKILAVVALSLRQEIRLL